MSLPAAIEEESKATVKVSWKRLDSGRGRGWQWWERLLQRKGGSVAATRVASCGCAWPRKNSDDRQEAAGASTFGASAAAREMGI
ncbi:hypothetical protein B296_00001932 [Ensete ventricosum]|uniref:Uncharacterized protein n=1 Tax=Ensete ventricosum TaxID=4639 RepID=A0A427B3M8_ENSVE|nr:hypothetical protein B296_00001932 [Ensete ventricosum]